MIQGALDHMRANRGNKFQLLDKNHVFKIDFYGKGTLFHTSSEEIYAIAIDSSDTLYLSGNSSKRVMKIETANGVKGTVTENFCSGFLLANMCKCR